MTLDYTEHEVPIRIGMHLSTHVLCQKNPSSLILLPMRLQTF